MLPLGALTALGKDIPLDTVDNKGVVWWVGTSGETSAFVNPHGNGMFVSWISNGTGTAPDTIDRAVANTHTGNSTNSWWKLDISLAGDRRLKPTYMRCQNRSSYDDQVPTNFVVQGSNNDSDWDTLYTGTTGFWTVGRELWTTIPLTANDSYRYFKYQLTSTNASAAWYICIAEYELFGTLTEG